MMNFLDNRWGEKKFLILPIGGMGNALMVVPILEKIKKEFPSASITVVLEDDPAKEIFQRLDYIKLIISKLDENLVKRFDSTLFDYCLIPFLGEGVRKVLKKEGIFVFSTGNPICEVRERINCNGKKLRVFGDYFKERKITGIWRNEDGTELKVDAFHITYETMINTILKNGFEIIGYKDCFPAKKAKKLFPEEYKECMKILHFCAWKVRKK